MHICVLHVGMCGCMYVRMYVISIMFTLEIKHHVWMFIRRRSHQVHLNDKHKFGIKNTNQIIHYRFPDLMPKIFGRCRSQSISESVLLKSIELSRWCDSTVADEWHIYSICIYFRTYHLFPELSTQSVCISRLRRTLNVNEALTRTVTIVNHTQWPFMWLHFK